MAIARRCWMPRFRKECFMTTATTIEPQGRRTMAPTASSTRSAFGRSLGLAIEPVFCPEDVADPFDTVEWDRRTAAIKDESGKSLFEQTDAEIPKSWSQLATNVVVNKKLHCQNKHPERENRVPQ